MKIGGYEFEPVCALEPTRDADDVVVAFMPQERYPKREVIRLNKYGNGPFCKFKIPNSYRVAGVYALMSGDALKYVGECAKFSARFNMGYGNISPKNCYEGGQQTNCRINNLIYDAARSGDTIELWFYPTPAYKAVESELRRALAPPWNRI